VPLLAAEIGSDAVIALAGCEDAVYAIEIGESADEDDLIDRRAGEAIERERPLYLVPGWAQDHFVDVDAAGSTIILALERRPPLMVSYDAGMTWTERGSGLPTGKALDIGENPDHVLYGARNRLYVSQNGGVFWRALRVELPEIIDVAWELDG
jgi:hypothetical protein